MRNPKKGSCFSRPKRGRGIRVLKTGERDDKVINRQEPHLAASPRNRDTNSHFSVLQVSTGGEGGGQAPSHMPRPESCRYSKCGQGWLMAFSTQLPVEMGNSYCTSNENLNLCSFYTFTKKTSLSPFHWSMNLILLWYSFFSILLFYGTVSSPLRLKCQKNWNHFLHIILCLTPL